MDAPGIENFLDALMDRMVIVPIDIIIAPESQHIGNSVLAVKIDRRKGCRIFFYRLLICCRQQCRQHLFYRRIIGRADLDLRTAAAVYGIIYDLCRDHRAVGNGH